MIKVLYEFAPYQKTQPPSKNKNPLKRRPLISMATALTDFAPHKLPPVNDFSHLAF
jgi:hypothetical protein